MTHVYIHRPLCNVLTIFTVVKGEISEKVTLNKTQTPRSIGRKFIDNQSHNHQFKRETSEERKRKPRYQKRKENYDK